MKDYEKVYLETMKDKKTLEEIAKELGKSVPTIKKWITNLEKNNTIKVVETKPSKETVAKSLYGRVTQEVGGKQVKIGAVMTGAASEVADEFLKKTQFKNNKHAKNIHRIYDEE